MNHFGIKRGTNIPALLCLTLKEEKKKILPWSLQKKCKAFRIRLQFKPKLSVVTCKKLCKWFQSTQELEAAAHEYQVELTIRQRIHQLRKDNNRTVEETKELEDLLSRPQSTYAEYFRLCVTRGCLSNSSSKSACAHCNICCRGLCVYHRR